MTVSVHIVTWNSKAFLPYLLSSLFRQTHQPSRILVVDNASSDGTIEFLSGWKGIHVLRNNRNRGFSHGHNQAIRLSTSDAVLIANPDVILEPTCLQELVSKLSSNDTIGSVCPRLLRFSLSSDDLREPVYSDTIDAAGMIVKRSRQVVNRGEGQGEGREFAGLQEVFGAPGVLAMYSRSALNDVAIQGEYFDEDFFAYKEDADLAWRLRSAGWTSWYVPTARAYHHRTVFHHGDSLGKVFHVREQRSSFYRVLSYRNHALMLIKNERLGTLLPHLPFILWYEFKKCVFILLREWSTLRGISGIIGLLPKAVRKRRLSKERVRVPPREMLRLFLP